MSNVAKSKTEDSKTVKQELATNKVARQRIMPSKTSSGKGSSIETASISFNPEQLATATVPNQMCLIIEAYYDLCDALDLEYGQPVKVIELQNSISSDVWKFKQDVTVVLSHYRLMINGVNPWKPKQDATIHAIGKIS
jgi:hypothetical protein